MVLAPTVGNNGCIALGVLLQFTVVGQFMWMLCLIVSLWLNLMDFTDGKEPLVVYIFISWGKLV